MRFGNLILLLSIFFTTASLSFSESTNDGGGKRDIISNRPPREAIRRWLNQRLTQKQKTILHEHIAILQSNHSELNEILKNASPEYAQLSTKDNLSPYDRRWLVEHRQKLIANTVDAKLKIYEIRELNRKFKITHPDIIPANPRIRPLKRGIREIRKAKREIDRLLAEDSTEYADLIRKSRKTQVDFARIARLRRELIKQNERAQVLWRQARAVRMRIRTGMRKRRLVPAQK